MINLYRGHIDLTHPKIKRHAEWHADNSENLYERQLEKFIYWYTSIERITYPVTAMIGGGSVLGFHPGTSRLVAQYLKGTKDIDCLVTFIIGLKNEELLYEVMPDAKRLNSEEVMAFDAGDGHWEFRLQGDLELFRNKVGRHIEWYERDKVPKVNKKFFWNKQPGIRWFHNETKELIIDRSKPGEKNIDINIFSPRGMFTSVAFLIDGTHEHTGSFQIIE